MIIGVVPWVELGITHIPTKYWWFPEMTASFLLFADPHRGRGADGRIGLHERLRRRRPRPARRRAHHRHRPRRDGHHDQRPDHRHRPQLGRAGRVRAGRRRVHQPDVRDVHPAVVPDPVVIGPGDRGDAHHGAARELRERARRAGRHGVPERQRPRQPRDADIRRGDGRPRHRARRAMAPGSASCGRVLLLLAILSMAVMSIAVLIK